MRWPRPVAHTTPGQFGRVLIGILGVYLASALIDQTRWGAVLIAGLASAVLVMALRAAGVSRQERYVGEGLVVVLLAASLIAAVLSSGASVVATGSWATMAFLTIAVILRRLLRQPEVTVHTLGGVVAAYLLFGLAFSAVYRAIDIVSSEGFFAQDSIQPIDFTYFSFVTLTTLGYGDLSPGTELGKALVTIEALVGQVFLVTVVSVVVSNLGGRRQVPAPEPTSGSEAPEGS